MTRRWVSRSRASSGVSSSRTAFNKLAFASVESQVQLSARNRHTRHVDFILSALAYLFGNVLGWSAVNRVHAAQDRRLIADDRVRCFVAAEEGRVLNIGTEWSSGTCVLSTGQIHFVPTMGIVGTRDIPVKSLHPTQLKAQENTPNFDGAAWFLIDTDRGQLIWGIPRATVAAVHQRLGVKSIDS